MNKPCILLMSHKEITPQKQQGSALVLAIFVIIIISLLGAALVSLQRDSAQGASYEIYASRAYLSAYSASELALVTLFPLNSSEVDSSNCTEVDIAVDLGDDLGFYGCSATYQCKILIPTNSTSLARRYKVVSTAVCENAQTVTRRQISIEALSL